MSEMVTVRTRKYIYLFIYLLYGLNTSYVVHGNNEEPQVWAVVFRVRDDFGVFV